MSGSFTPYEALEEIFEEATNELSTAGDRSLFNRWKVQRPGLIDRAQNIVRRRLNAGYEQLNEYELSEIAETASIEAVSETTGLLSTGSTAVATGVGTSATAVGSTAFGTVGTAVGVTLGTAAVGAGIAAAISGGATLPGHKNIGPGNEPDPEGVDEDDQIAYRHDIRYTNAKTQEDIQEADDIAIQEFSEDFANTGNIHSAIGRVGIQGKRTLEGQTGVLYPPNLPKRELCLLYAKLKVLLILIIQNGLP